MSTKKIQILNNTHKLT